MTDKPAEEKPKLNRSLREKKTARIAAVQALYTHLLNAQPMNVAAICNGWKNAPTPLPFDGPPPHVPTLRALLEGVTEHEDALNAWIAQYARQDWKRERMNPLTLAILQLAAYEMKFKPTLGAHVVVAQYTELAEQFLDASEVDFVHALLQKWRAALRE